MFTNRAVLGSVKLKKEVSGLGGVLDVTGVIRALTKVMTTQWYA